MPRLRQQPHQLILAAIRVLIFVDHDELEAPVVKLAQRFVVFQQPDGFQQQIVEIERIRLPQTLFVEFVNLRHARQLRIRRRLVPVQRRFVVALAVADAGKHAAIRHELFIQPNLLVDRLRQAPPDRRRRRW